jgi:DNA-binding transcriptional LysR family regulator
MIAIMPEPYRPGYAGGMAKTGGSRGSRGRGSAPRRDAAAKRSGTPAPKPGAKKPPARTSAPAPPEPPAITGTFVLGVIPGATPGKWVDAWKERMPHAGLELRPIAVAGQRAEVLDGGLDAALVRLPLDSDGLHVIALYDELPVVVAAADSHLMAADELTFDDLAGEVVVRPEDDVLGVEVPGAVAASFAPPRDTEEAIAIVASGVGAVIVPMSLARLHHRKDADYRVLRDGPASTVALAWPADRTTPSVDAFVGIVRGRTANSSR